MARRNREMCNRNYGVFGRNSSFHDSFPAENFPLECSRNMDNFQIDVFDQRWDNLMDNYYRSRSRSPLYRSERSLSPDNNYIMDYYTPLRNERMYYNQDNFADNISEPQTIRQFFNGDIDPFRTHMEDFEYMDSVESDDGSFSPEFLDNLSQRSSEDIMYGDILHDHRNYPKRKYKNEIKIRIFKDNIRHISQTDCEKFMLTIQQKINQFSPRNNQVPCFFDLNWKKGEFTMKCSQNAYDWLKKLINRIKIVHCLDIIPEIDIKYIKVTVPHTHVLGLAPVTFLDRIKRQNNLNSKKWFCTFTSHSGKWTYFNFELDPISTEQLKQNSFVYYGIEKLQVSFIDNKKI